MAKLQRPTDEYKAPIVDREKRLIPILRITFLVILLLAAASATVYLQPDLNNQLILGALGLFGMLGVFFLLSSVIGLVEFMPKRQSEDLAKSFLDNHPDGLLITDQKGWITYANAAYGNLTGTQSATEMQTLETLLSRHRESNEALYRLMSGLREGREGQEEFRLMRALGPVTGRLGAHWYRLKVRSFQSDKSAKKPLYIWQITNITAERDEQERFFKDLQNAIDYLDHAPAGFFSAGRNGEIFYINATLAEWLGLDLTKFIPGSIKIGDIVAGDSFAQIQSIHDNRDINDDVRLDVNLRKANGQSFPAQIVHSQVPTRDGAPGESRTIVLAASQYDPVGKPPAEPASVATTRFARFFNNTPMAIASINEQGRILRTNTAFLKLFSNVVSHSDIEDGVSIENLVHVNEQSLLAQALAQVKNQQSEIAPLDTRNPKDETRHFRFYVNAVFDQSPEEPQEAAIVYAIEITEQKALEAQMAQTQKLNAVGTLAGGIAHDFNNVLTAILLSADHLLLQARPADAGFADLMEIKRNANRAAVLVRQLLAFSRKQTMRPVVLNLTDVIGDLRMLVDRLISGTNITLQIDYGRDLWPVKTDLSQFEQVVINLCVNARDAMPDGGTLVLRTRNVSAQEVSSYNYADLSAEDMVMIEVTDTGTGIAPDIFDKIFEPFFTTKEVGKGTGLGLAMVYGIIKQSGGYIQPESEVGKGTTFRIFLPRYLEDIVELSAEQVSVESHHAPIAIPSPAAKEDVTDLTGKSAVVLLVEDEDAVRRGGKRMLETRGYTVHEASSGIEALDIMEELDGQVDIVVSDVVMPEMDGPSLLRELRIKYPDLKFIFVSGYAEDAFARNLPPDAQFGFLSKPFSLKQLAVVVRETLDS